MLKLEPLRITGWPSPFEYRRIIPADLVVFSQRSKIIFHKFDSDVRFFVFLAYDESIA